MTLLLGFTEVLEMLALEDKRINHLADMVFEFEEDVIKHLPKYGFDGVAFFDDWGTQTNLILSPAMWRSFYLPRYKRQFELAHKLGLTVYFHSCGYIEAIIDDLIDAGVDFLNLSQPNLYDLKRVGDRYGGRVCFVSPISYQTTSIKGSDTDIWKEAEQIITSLGGPGKAVIGYLEEYEAIGLSTHNYKTCEKAFQVLGAYSHCNN
jgi:uroporphyrinogen-III decarboxylase